MFISCDYLFYPDDNTVIYPKFSNFLRILEMFSIPFAITLGIYHFIGLIPKFTSLFFKMSISSNIFGLLCGFVIFSFVFHSIFYLLFSINYYNGYYSVMILNLLCFISIFLWCFLGFPNRYNFIYLAFVFNVTLVILGCKDSLLFTIDDDGRLILNRNENISMIIVDPLYAISIVIENKVLKEIKYEIYLLSLLSQKDIMLLSAVDQLKKKVDNPIRVEYAKVSDYARVNNMNSEILFPEIAK